MYASVHGFTFAVNTDPQCGLFQSLCWIPCRGSPAVNYRERVCSLVTGCGVSVDGRVWICMVP